ncbi:MAG: flagellar export chaperone FliS [Nitrospirae bacterium]|nr:flagellar export chaperone FliS [Nitrospirota bacterium]
MNITGYRKTVLATTDRVQIILMLYEGALTHLRIARQKIGVGDVISKGTHFGKATAIISELSNVLDMEKGGEIAVNLRSLYDYVLRRLLHANMNNDVLAVEEAEKIIGMLKDGWKEMMKELKQQPLEVGV